MSADVPDVEACVFVGDGFDVEADGGDGVDVGGGAGGELEGVEDGCVLILVYVRLKLDFGASYWSFLLRRDPASAGAFLCCRRFWRGSGRWRRPLWTVLRVASAWSGRGCLVG